MDNIHLDLIIQIACHLNNKDKLNLFLTSKRIYACTPYVKFSDQVHLSKILSSEFFDSYTNILFDSGRHTCINNKVCIFCDFRLPRRIKCLKFAHEFNEELYDKIKYYHTAEGRREYEHLETVEFGYYFIKCLVSAFPGSVKTVYLPYYTPGTHGVIPGVKVNSRTSQDMGSGYVRGESGCRGEKGDIGVRGEMGFA